MTSQPARRRLKRWSIVALLGTDVAAATAACIAAAVSNDHWTTVAWLAAASAAITLPIQLALFLRLQVGRTSRNLTAATAYAGAAGGVALLASIPERTPWPTVTALAGFATIQIYARWYTRLARTHQQHLTAGAAVPDFEVTDLEGQVVTPETFLGQPVVFVFIRGNWCPLCVAQVRELAADYQSLADRGIQIALVSPQPLDETKALAERFGVEFHYLVDHGAAAARRLGIAHDGGVPPGVTQLGYDVDTVFPTVLVVDADGTIVFSDQTDDYRVRPEPQLFLRALAAREAQAEPSHET